MKQTPDEKQIRERMEPGALTRDGYLGDDPRTISEIIAADAIELDRLNLTPEQFADRMEFFMTVAFDSIEDQVLVDDNWEVEYQSFRGFIVCPFRHPGRYRKGLIRVTSRKSGASIEYTPMNVHLIREHGFFEGRGSTHRLEPALLAAAIF